MNDRLRELFGTYWPGLLFTLVVGLTVLAARSDYWCHSFIWAGVGLIAGIGLGNLIWSPSREELRMSIRTRTRLRDVVIGLLLIAVGGFTLISAQQGRQRDQDQRECLAAYIAANSETAKVRSRLVAEESEATRSIVRGAFTAKSAEEARRAFRLYTKALHRIDRARSQNPLPEFEEDSCE